MDLILDPASWPRWQPEIVATEGPDRLSTTDVVRGRATMLGFNVQGHSTATEVGPDTFVEDVIVGVRMRVTYTIAASAEGATVTQSLVSDLPTGLWGRVLSFFVRGYGACSGPRWTSWFVRPRRRVPESIPSCGSVLFLDKSVRQAEEASP